MWQWTLDTSSRCHTTHTHTWWLRPPPSSPEELHFTFLFGLLGLSFILGRDTPYWLFVALVLAIRVSLFPYQLRNPSQASRLKTCFFPTHVLRFHVAEMLVDDGPDISGPLAETSALGQIFPVPDRIYPVQAGTSAPGAGYIRP